jgi:hypothetical protein
MAAYHFGAALMSAANIEDILSRATDGLRELLKEAYESGRAKEREDMKRELVAFLSHKDQSLEIALAASSIALVGSGADLHVVRAPAGTVKPQIKVMIENASDGITASEIIEKTGFKENSVRGTLSALKTEGFAKRRGEFWFLSERKGPLAVANEPS